MAEVNMGHSYGRPRGLVTIDASALGSATAASEKRLVLIGSANGGQPNVPYELTSFQEARRILRGGDLLDAIEFAWNPGGSSRGAGRIIAIRVDQASPATLEADGLTFTSKIYGNEANGVQVAWSTNEDTDSKRLEVYFTRERGSNLYDNIGNIFNIRYTGDEAQATVEVTHSNGQASELILRTGDTTEDMTVIRRYNLGVGIYEESNQLANDINNLPDFEAYMSAYGDRNVESNKLDELSPTDVKSEQAVIRSVIGDLLNQTANDSFVTVEATNPTNIPETIELTNLEGGTNGTVPPSWADIFPEIAKEGAYYVVPLTDKTSIHGELAQFLRDENAAGNHLRGIVGGGIRESREQLKSRQTTIRGDRMTLAGSSGIRRMQDGRSLNFPGYLFAALVGGMASGSRIGDPVTFNEINIEALDTNWSSSDLDYFDANGILMAEYVRNRSVNKFRIVSDVTTYNNSREIHRSRMSIAEISDFLATDLRDVMENEFIGTRLEIGSESLLKNRVESFLDIQKDVGGLIVDYRREDIQVNIQGRRAEIFVTVQPGLGLDFINIRITYEEPEMSA